jgi:hypothetical protein
LPDLLRLVLPTALVALTMLAAACSSSGESEIESGSTLVDDPGTATVPVQRPTSPLGPVGTGNSTVIALGDNGSLDVCDIVPVDDAQRLLGRDLSAPRGVNLGAPLGQVVCTFGSTDRSYATVLQVSIVAQNVFDEDLLQTGYTIGQLFDETRALYPSSVKVHGIGDDAFRHNDTLEVLHGEYAIGVSLSLGSNFSSQAAPLETLAAIAELAIANLGDS